MPGLLTDIRYVLFDWGGTLCSVAGEAETWRRSIAALLTTGQQAGMPLHLGHTDSLVTLFLTTRAKAENDPDLEEIELIPVLRGWLAEQDISGASTQALEAMERAYWEPWVGCLKLVDGAAETLRTLRRRGYHLGLVSNVTTPPHWCRLELQRLGLWALLDCVTFSSGLGVRKPHRRMYQDALAKLGDGRAVEASHVLFVGDSPACDVAAPAELGMRTALLRPGQDSPAGSDLEGLNPDLVVDSLTDLLPHLPGPA